ncbi:hypothetical protein HLPCO_002116 [Haloplasma contractile SSD-17B]|uniref:Uncharacterized protein n=2 Tax=Haloplasma TaxID=471824 RepID=U2EAM8_9MOLU|nr:hypothetical protein HLPCO_002116 [Haloplasma contractile SSD-17B]
MYYYADHMVNGLGYFLAGFATVSVMMILFVKSMNTSLNEINYWFKKNGLLLITIQVVLISILTIVRHLVGNEGMMSDKVYLLFPLLVCLNLIATGFEFLYKYRRRLKSASHIKGTIIGFKKGIFYYYPVIKYTDPEDGQVVRYESEYNALTKIGLHKQVKLLLYKEDGKKKCQRKSVLFMYLVPALFTINGLSGLVLILITIGAFLFE